MSTTSPRERIEAALGTIAACQEGLSYTVNVDIDAALVDIRAALAEMEAEDTKNRALIALGRGAGHAYEQIVNEWQVEWEKLAARFSALQPLVDDVCILLEAVRMATIAELRHALAYKPPLIRRSV